MARHFEYIIQGPPLSPETHAPKRHKTLSPKHNRQDSNLRILYRTSATPSDLVQFTHPPQEHRVSSPTTPKPPPTPPSAEDEKTVAEEVETQIDGDGAGPTVKSKPATPVNPNSPPTPDDTPPRELVKLPPRQFLALRPSIASTHAESFRTARENIFSDDEPDYSSPPLTSAFATPLAPSDLPALNGESQLTEANLETAKNEQPRDHDADANRPSSPIFPPSPELQFADAVPAAVEDTPKTQFQFVPSSHIEPHADKMVELPTQHDPPVRRFTVYEQVTEPVHNPPKRGKTLRDRLEQTKQIQPSVSTEKFASIIGWNEGVHPTKHETEANTNRLSGVSNLSAVEAYVVESPIKPRKRGTLRKVIKNDSLRSASSPIPDSKRNSLQSTSDSTHRLLHKKQKLNDQNRWSASSEISKRSLSLSSNPSGPRMEVIKVAVIPERSSSLHTTSANSSRRHSRSRSGSSVRGLSSMPPVTIPTARQKRAFSDSNERSSLRDRPPQVPVRSSSLSAPTSRSGSRANSVTSDHFSAQRQAEKDLRTTLDRMESERLSASLRRLSDQSTPTPSPKPLTQELFPDATTDRETTNNSESAQSIQRPMAIELNGIAPGTKEWADLRPSELTGTPFSQPSMISASPEIIEAKAINFFPHNNESLQLIEPNRLSESQAVRALKAQHIAQSNTAPLVVIDTPQINDFTTTPEQPHVDSPLRNPRKPPEPPQFKVIPPTPLDELDHQLGVTPDTSPAKSRTGAKVLRKRPSLQGRGRSESFVKAISRGLSLRNARNPKAGEELDSTLHPFWRPRAFWDDDEYAERSRRERERELDAAPKYEGTTQGDRIDGPHDTKRTVIVHPRGIKRSNSIATGPMSLMRHISEKRRQRKTVDEHLAQQQALVKQSSYSSLQKLNAGRRLYAFPGRTLSMNAGLERLKGLQGRLVSVRARREDEKREKRREALRKSIGAEVVSQGDSRFWDDGAVNGNGVKETDLEHARAEGLVEKRGLRM
ncbi:hypothetical protein H2198_009495 [Neophaeococcomyces mojaviensis]|uniref:Uncharacterized protein n=1 Tax=Neophaeococcomyces mojaviensis TaxID=3383035 RepID=A0ACC2ZUH1_9EURO|nr:hypothetical protein H2198_009495 [Knufia sp. JES_112]